jgi:hypothetical protein
VAKNDELGFLEAAAIATPAAIGVGFGIRNLIQTTKIVPEPSAINVMQNIARQAEISQVNVSAYRGFVRNKFGQGIDADIARSAWTAAMSSVDPITRNRLLDFTHSLTTMPDKEVATAISHTVKTNTSLYMRSIYNRFVRNAEALLGQRATSPSSPIGFAAVPAAEEALSIFKPLPKNLESRLDVLQKSLGEYSLVFKTTPAANVAGFGVYDIRFAGGPGGDINIRVPLSRGGIAMEGMTMQTTRLAPRVGIAEGGKITEMSREEFFLEQIEKSILPDIKTGRLASKREVDRAISRLYQQTFVEVESYSSMVGAAQTSAQRLRERLRGDQIQILKRIQRKVEGKEGFVSAYGLLTPEEYSDIMIKNKVYGGTSPTAISKGFFMREDISQLDIAPTAKGWGRRPESAYREYQLTSESAARLEKLQGARFRQYQEMQSDEYKKILREVGADRPLSPSLYTVYIDPEKQKTLLSKMHMREGHGVLASDVAGAMEFESVVPMRLKELREDLVSKIGKGPFTIQRGEVLGIGMMGDIVKARETMDILDLEAKATAAEGDYAQLAYRQRSKAIHGTKFFDASRITMLLMGRRKQDRIMKQQLHFQNMEAFLSMDDLRKDRQLFRRQIITSLGVEMDNAKRAVALGNAWDRAAALNDERFVQYAMNYTRKKVGYINPEAFGRIFGAAGFVLGDETAEAVARRVGVSAEHIGMMQKGLAGGVGRFAFDSPPAMKGAGTALGSLEPRIFETLRDPHWGPLGGELSAELTERMIATDPEKYMVHKELQKTRQSLIGKIKPGRGVTPFKVEDYGRGEFQDWMMGLGKEGGWMRRGKGLTDVYVPGPELVSKMRPFQTAAGLETVGVLSDIYHNIAAQASEMYYDIGPATREETVRGSQQYIDELAYHWAPGGKGMGGYLRGRLTGSRYLRAMSISAAGDVMREDLQTAGITQSMAERMFGELEEQYGKESVAEMRARFTQGERVAGLVARHPTTGPFSMQPMFFQRVAGEESQIIMPERQMDVMIKGRKEPVTLKLGPAVGMNLDYDADQAAAFMVSPNNEQKIRTMLNTSRNEYTKAYMQHQIRYQLVKAGKATGEAGGLSIREMMAADVRKLGITQNWVPQLSVEMGRGRAALGMFGRGQAAEDAKFLLEWLEQTPISAKHLRPEDVARGDIEDMMTRLHYSFRRRDRTGLENVIRSITRGNQEASNLLTQQIELDTETARRLGVEPKLRGANVRAATEELMRSLGEFETTGAQREFVSATGRARRVRPSDMAAGIKNVAEGPMSGASRLATATVNVMGSIGRGVIRNKKPLGIGFGASIAIASLLSSPEDTIGPGNNLNIGLRSDMSPGKGADRMTPETMMPSPPPIGQPSVPPMFVSPQARIGSDLPSPQANISVNVGSNVNPVALSYVANNMTKGPTSVNIRDNRESLSPHRIANKIL